MPLSAVKPVRCAIYTRKSTEEGLEQEFNTLDAQRECAEAYVLSQRHEHWTALPERYDDGGFSGANLERPALRRLLADVEAGAIDGVVVYKVDRLSRSLIDFARIMEILDRHQFRFVSVTQPLNTHSSMGRLTLNMLLSFAQFEREIISERTRDKIRAARRKGKWTGGFPMLGYDPDPATRKLVVNEQEAQKVRGIFQIFLETRSLAETLEELDQRGWRTKGWTTQKSKPRTGVHFDRPTLIRVLTNPVYIGEVRHGGSRYPGEQPAIIDRRVWERAKQLLKQRKQSAGRERERHSPLLAGKLTCAICGRSMVHGYTDKNGRRYRYYLCQKAHKNGAKACPGQVVAARRIEQAVLAQLAERDGAAELRPHDPEGAVSPDQHRKLGQRIRDVRHDHRIEQAVLRLKDEPDSEIRITLRKEPSGRRYPILPAAEPPRIARIMALAIRWDKLLEAGLARNYQDLATRANVSVTRVGQILKLCNLAPALQERLLFWTPDTLYISEAALRRLAQQIDWGRQRTAFELLVT